MAKKKAGRPAGSKTKQRAVIQTTPAVCPRCGSTSRKVQRIAVEKEISGIFEGEQYSHVVWRDMICECGQCLRERRYESRAAG